MDPRTARRRRRGRELAAQMLSSWDANPVPPLRTISDVGGLTRASSTHLEFAEQLARAAWERLEVIDRCLAETTTPYWRENMGRVERSVLRVAVAELLTGNAPPRVVLSEAIEVARRYAGESATPFVHAVLDGVLRRQGIVVESDVPAAPDPASVRAGGSARAREAGPADEAGEASEAPP